MPDKISLQDVIERTRALIADPQCWTAHAETRDPLGRRVEPGDPNARSFCAVAALERAAFELTLRTGSATDLALAAACVIAGCTDPDEACLKIIRANDREGREEVVRLFDDALARLRASEAA